MAESLIEKCLGWVSAIMIIIVSYGFMAWWIYESSIPAIEYVKVLRATYPLVIELKQDQFLQDNDGTISSSLNGQQIFDNQLVHLVGHLYTYDSLRDSEFGVSFDNGEILLLNRDVEVYYPELIPGGDHYEYKWQHNITLPTRCHDGGQNGKELIPFSNKTF